MVDLGAYKISLPMQTEPFASGESKFFAQLVEFGYQPRVVFDVGASNGGWSATINQIFSSAEFHLFEPLAGNCRAYDDILGPTLANNRRLKLHPVALGDQSGTATLHVTDDGFGSSIHPMPVKIARPVSVPCWRLEEYVTACELPPPNVLKLDVQGFEVFVLEGAGALLAHVDVLLVETWLTREYGPNTPLITELVQVLSSWGFVLVDLCGPYYGERKRLTSLDGIFLSTRLLDQIKEPSRGWDW